MHRRAQGTIPSGEELFTDEIHLHVLQCGLCLQMLYMLYNRMLECVTLLSGQTLVTIFGKYVSPSVKHYNYSLTVHKFIKIRSKMK